MNRSLPRLACLSLTSLTALAALAAPALAQEAPEPPGTPLVFPTLGPDGLTGGATIQVGIQDPEGSGSQIKRLDLGGQFLGASGMGAYGSIALETVEDIDAIGDIELGAMYRVQRPNVDTALRFGLVLPTASEEFDSAFLGIISTALARPSDLITSAPQTTSLRLAVAPTYRSGKLVLRADAGVDIGIDAEGSAPDPIVHLDLAAGYDTGSVGVTGELQSVASTDSDADGTLHVLALSAQGRVGKLTPYGTVSFPFATEDDDLEGSFNVFAGLRAAL